MANTHNNTLCNSYVNHTVLNLFVKDKHNTYTINRAISEDEIIAAAKILLARRLEKARIIQSTNDCRNFLVTQMGHYESEVFCVLFLDNQKGIIAIEEMFKGTINQSIVYPREVVKQALKHNAANIILAHNHPSGKLNPSQADIDITEQLQKALALIDMRVLDHIIVAGGQSLSFMEKGLL